MLIFSTVKALKKKPSQAKTTVWGLPEGKEGGGGRKGEMVIEGDFTWAGA